MHPQKLDKIDMKIIHELSLDCRQTVAQIARKARTSKNTVFYRMRQLEKNKVILKYQCVTDYSKITGTYCRIGIKLSSRELGKEFIEGLKNNKSIHWAGTARGRYDLVMVLFYEEFAELKKFSDFLHANLKIENFRVSMLNALYRCNNNFAFDKIIGNPVATNFINTKKSVDNIDIKILRALMRNSRATIIDIAQESGITPKTALSRKRRLEKQGIIQGYTAILNHEFFDLKYYRVYVFCNDSTEHKSIRNHLLSDPEVAYVVEPLAGVSDFEIEIYSKDAHEAYLFCDGLRKKFNTIKDYEFLYVDNKLKDF